VIRGIDGEGGATGAAGGGASPQAAQASATSTGNQRGLRGSARKFEVNVMDEESIRTARQCSRCRRAVPSARSEFLEAKEFLTSKQGFRPHGIGRARPHWRFLVFSSPVFNGRIGPMVRAQRGKR